MVPATKSKKLGRKLPSNGAFTKVQSKAKIVKKSKSDSAGAPAIVLKPTKNLNALSPFLRLKHVPYGFFEEEAFKYFSQYGVVTRIRVKRNDKGGFSGIIYVAFKFAEVATVVQTIMHNSIMMKDHVIKCEQLREKDVPSYVRFGSLYGNKPKKLNSGCIKEKIEEAYENDKGDDISKIDGFLSKSLVQAKANGVDYDFDYSKKLKLALKNQEQKSAVVKKGVKV